MARTRTLTLGAILVCTSRAAFAQNAPPPLPPAPASDTEPPPPMPLPPAPAPTTTAQSSPTVGAPGYYAPASPSVEPPAAAVVAPGKPASGSPVELMSLRLMREKGIISQAEYESAVHDLSESVGMRAPSEGTVVLGKWATTLYGFVEADAISDSTRSFNDLAGNAAVSRAGSQAGENSRFTLGERNSRVGLRMKAPELSGVRASGQLEFDFIGMPSLVGATTPPSYSVSGFSEGAFGSNPILRVRHLNVKVETPVVDFLFGQYWQLFGYQPLFIPAAVEIQGVPGEIFSRTPQFRISKTVKVHPIAFEIAVAATRPVQRDTGIPDGQGGIRLAVDSWTGVQTAGSSGTQIAPLSVAATALVRRVEVDQFAAIPKSTKELVMSAYAIDGFIPIIPGTKDQKGNSLSLNGEYASGYGFADLYTGLTGGITFPTYPAPAPGGTQAIPNIDNGIVTYDAGGGLHGIQWTTYIFGAQYYLPGLDGKVFLSGNYSHLESANSHFYGVASKVTAAEDWFDVNLFADPLPAVRLGLEYANFNSMTVDGIHSINHRVQFSGFYLF